MLYYTCVMGMGVWVCLGVCAHIANRCIGLWCVCACVRACVRVCACECACEGASVRACVYACECTM